MASSSSAWFRPRYVAVATGLTAAAVAASGAHAALAAPASTTLRLTTTQIKDAIVNGVDIAADRDVQAGKTTGYDVTTCALSRQTHSAACEFAVARARGLLFGKANVSLTDGTGSGVVSGGTRGLSGAHGTVTIAPGPHGSSVITLTFRR